MKVVVVMVEVVELAILLRAPPPPSPCVAACPCQRCAPRIGAPGRLLLPLPRAPEAELLVQAATTVVVALRSVCTMFPPPLFVDVAGPQKQIACLCLQWP